MCSALGAKGDVTYAWNNRSFYNLADKLCLTSLKDEIFDTVFHYNKENSLLPSPSMISATYKDTPSNSGLCKYACRSLVWLITIESKHLVAELHQAIQSSSNLSHHVIAEMIGSSGKQTLSPNAFPVCDYHSHGDGAFFILCRLGSEKRTFQAKSARISQFEALK